MQTITTKYIGPSNTKGSRIKASCEAKSIIRSKDCSLSTDNAHIVVAQELKDAMGWQGVMIGGHTKEGMIFVFQNSDYILK